MYTLKREKKVAVLTALVEGSSVRSTERMVQAHRDTILRLLVKVGAGCERLLDSMMRDLPCQRIQVDELWGFIAKKQRHLQPADNPSRTGNIWTFVAIDPDSKLVPSYRVGKRDLDTATDFLTDLSSRLSNRVQLSSDSLKAYVDGVEQAFGTDIDYGQIVKSYEAGVV